VLYWIEDVAVLGGKGIGANHHLLSLEFRLRKQLIHRAGSHAGRGVCQGGQHRRQVREGFQEYGGGVLHQGSDGVFEAGGGGGAEACFWVGVGLD